MDGIAVVGDACIDIYQYCVVDRLAPERPVPVVDVRQSIETPGMAANVHRNLLSMGVEATLFCNADWRQHKKTRIVDRRSNHMFLRVDETPESGETAMPEDVIDQILQFEVVVLADYDKGFLSEEIIADLTANHRCVFLDSKKLLGEWATKARFVKINESEYRASVVFIEEELRDRTIRTQGAHGCTFKGVNYPVKRQHVLDVSGAGDTFHAGLVAAYRSCSDIEQSIAYANECASRIVQLPGMSLPDGFPELP